jgi:hypothetical protein
VLQQVNMCQHVPRLGACAVCGCLQGLTFPLLENANEWIVHGYAYNDYLKELDPPTQIGRVGGSLDKAFASEAAAQWSRPGKTLCTSLPSMCKRPLLHLMHLLIAGALAAQ